MSCANPNRYVVICADGQPVGVGNPLPISVTAGGGGPVTIADGADVTQGAIADAAVTGDTAGTNSAKLRGLLKILTNVWDSVNSRLNTTVQDIKDGAGDSVMDAANNAIRVNTVVTAAPLGVVSTSNSTTTTLGSGAVYIGTGESVLAYEAITLNIEASHASATDGISVEWSNDNTNWDRAEKFMYRSAAQDFSVTFRPKGEFYRVVYTNGGLAQTAFRLETILHPTAPYADPYAVNGRAVLDGISYPIKWTAITITKGGGFGDKTIIPAVAGRRLRILGINFTNGADNAIRFESGTTTLIERMPFNKGDIFSENSGSIGFWVETAPGEAFVMDIEKDESIRGRVLYIEVP